MGSTVTVKHVGEGIAKDAHILSGNHRQRAFCRKCSLEKSIVGGHFKKPLTIFGFVCAACGPPREPYVQPPPKAAPPKPAPRGHLSADRARLIALVRGDREIRGLTYRQIAESRGLSVYTVAGWINYRVAPHIDPAVESA